MEKILENLLDIKIVSTFGLTNFKFDDDKIEKEYLKSNEPEKLKKSKIIFLCFFIIYLTLVIISFSNAKDFLIIQSSKISDFKIIIDYFLFISMIIDLFFNYLLFKTLKNLENKIKEKLTLFRIIWLILCIFLQTMENILIGEDYNIISRNIYFLIFLKNFLYFAICQNCLIIFIFLTILVVLMINLLFIFDDRKNNSINVIIDIGFEFLIGTFIFFLKKNLEIKNRNKYLEKIKIRKYYALNEDIKNNLNCYHLAFENEDLIYSNSKFDEILVNFSEKTLKTSIFKRKLIKCNSVESKKQLNFNKKNESNSSFKESLNLKSQRLISDENLDVKSNDKIKKNLNNKKKFNKFKFLEKEKNNNNCTEYYTKINIEKEEIKESIKEFFEELKICDKEIFNKNIFDGEKPFNFDTLNDFFNIISQKNISKKNSNENINKKLNKSIISVQSEIKILGYENDESNLKINDLIKTRITLKEKNTKLFVLVGEFVTFNKYFNINKLVKNQKIFEIYFKRTNKITEFLIKEITDKKLSLKIDMENIKKQESFAKTASQFRIPLKSIVSLISKIKNNLDLKILSNDNIDLLSIKNYQNLENDLNIISDLSDYTMNLISDIIQTHSKNNLNEIKIKTEDVSLSKILIFNYDILKSLISSFDNKAISIKPILKIDENLKNFNINTDEFRLNQIILNLLYNSVKFTKSGIIKINSEIINSEDNKNVILIKIEDTGMGIKNNHNELIIKDLNIINLNNDVIKMGSGFGLSLSAKIAKRLNYKLSFTSIENKGTSFFIEIPIETNSLKNKDLKIFEKSNTLNNNKLMVAYNKDILSLKSSIKSNSDLEFINSDRIKDNNLCFLEKFIINENPKINLKNKVIFSHNNIYFQNFNDQFVSSAKLNESFNITINNKNNELMENIKNNFYTSRSYFKECGKSNADLNNKFKNYFERDYFCEFENSNKNILKRNRSHRDKNSNFTNEKYVYINKGISKSENEDLSNTIQIKDDQLNMCFRYDNLSRNVILKDNQYNVDHDWRSSERTITERNLKKSNKMLSKSNLIVILDEGNKSYKSSNKSFFYENTEKILENDKSIIILIDDNKFIRESQKFLLEKILLEFNLLNKFQIIEGGDGIDLLKYIIDIKYMKRIKLIITDENMEYMNGSQAIKFIREMENDRKILKTTIITSTCFENNISEEYILKSGADLVIKKPLSKNNLIKELFKYNVLN